jgi:hypothetical protein
MTLANALVYAQRTANRTGSSVVVYRCTHQPEAAPAYGFDYTLPTFGERVGDRIYPDAAFSKEDCEEANRTAVLLHCGADQNA